MRTTTGGLLCAAALLAGCTDVDGEAQPESTASRLTFDSCDDMPIDAVRAAGLDPSTTETGIMGSDQPGWTICDWSGEDGLVTIYVGTVTLDDIRRRSDFTDFHEVDLDGWAALEFRDASDESGDRCLVAASGHSVTMMLAVTATEKRGRSRSEPCAMARAKASALLPHVVG